MHRALIAVAAALVLPATASATTYCVQNPDCEQAGGTSKLTIQDALDAAANHVGHDDVSIGAGTFVGNFMSDDGAGVTIRGLGAGKTVLSPGMSGPPTYPVTLAVSGPSRLTGLRVSLAAIASAQGVFLAGGAVADNITIDGGITEAGGAELDGATLSDSTVDVGGSESIAVRVTGAGATLERDSMSGSAGVLAQGAVGSKTRVHAVRLRAIDESGASALHVDSGDVELTDALLEARTSAYTQAFSMISSDPASKPNVDARHLTIIGSGLPGQVGGHVYSGSGGASLTLRDSIISGFDTPVSRKAVGADAVVALDRVDRWPDHPVDDVPGGGQITDVNALAVDPGFADAAGDDFSLGASSPLVDAGTPGGLEPGERDTDLAGAPRITDGNGDCGAARDIGAYERASATCAPAAGVGLVTTPPSTVSPGADATAPRLWGVKLRRRHGGLVVRFRLSERATVKVKAGKRSTTRVLAAGGRRLRVAKVARGRIKVRLSATDAAGNRATLTRRMR